MSELNIRKPAFILVYSWSFKACITIKKHSYTNENVPCSGLSIFLIMISELQWEILLLNCC